ncbi:MAG: cache domain-containing protein [Bdellovibrionales bacterium]
MLNIVPLNRVHPKLLRIIALLFIALSMLTAYMLDNYHATLMMDRQDKTETLVDNAYSLINYYYLKSAKDELTTAQAQKYALESIKQLSLDQDGYFWVMDTHPSMVMHPIQPALDGLDLTDYVGPDGRKLFLEMVQIAKSQESGFIKYQWTKPKHDRQALYPKISFIRLFAPWNWIVGSGVYVDDVDAAFWNAVYVACGISIAILMFILTLAITVTESLKKT